MKIAALKEITTTEKRVAITPDAVKRFTALDIEVHIELDAGIAADIPNHAYIDAGATIHEKADDCLKNTSILLSVSVPKKEVLEKLKKGTILVGMLQPYQSTSAINQFAKQGLHSFSLELLPRISRAQSMDVLSSQSNLAGYRSVIEAVNAHGKVVPMMMTAAGTITPAKVLVLGAGVAGLQAIATAKRLGAVVSAFDVRSAVKEQVESLGAKFIEVQADTQDAETSGGYAKEMSDDYKRKQATLLADTVPTQDIIITTALIPGKKAPILIDKTMVESMQPGSVIVDLAASAGGNCTESKADKTVIHEGIHILGPTNLPSHCAKDASQLYSRNLYEFVSKLLVKDGKLAVNWDDELVKGTCLTKDGNIVHDAFVKAKAPSAAKKAEAKPKAEVSETKPKKKVGRPKKSTTTKKTTSKATPKKEEK